MMQTSYHNRHKASFDRSTVPRPVYLLSLLWEVPGRFEQSIMERSRSWNYIPQNKMMK